MPSPLPRQVRWNRFAQYCSIDFGLPQVANGSAPALIFSWPAQRSLTLRPTDSPSRLTRPSTPEAPTALLSPPPLRLLPGGAIQFPGGPFIPLWTSAFHGAPQPPDLPPVRLMDLGFAVLCPLARHRRPPIRFLFIGSRLCSTLLSGPASRRVLFQLGSNSGAPAVGGGLPSPLFRLRIGFSFPPWLRFRRPPYNPVRPDFPGTVRNLGLSSMGLPSLERFKRWFACAPLPWFAHSIVPPHASAYRQLCVWPPRCR